VVSGHNGQSGLAQWLARVAAGGPAIPAPGLGPEADNIDESGLDVRTYALVRLAAVVAAGESGQCYARHVAAALDQGVTPDEVIGVLVALLPAVGVTRVTEAAPGVFGAIGRVAGDLPAVQLSGRG
jgi:alkylhydroperoxidase/carboxymuconolactone decarboxylase family protein YurZ